MLPLQGRNVLLPIWSVGVQAIRCRNTIMPKKPRAPHRIRDIYNIMLKPWFLRYRDGKTLPELCRRGVESQQKAQPPHPYEMILARELREHMENSQLVAFFHHNHLYFDEKTLLRALLSREQMRYDVPAQYIMNLAFKDTPYKYLLRFFRSRNLIVFSHEPNVKKLLQVTKKFKHLHLIYALLNNRLICRDELLEFAQVTDKSQVQAKLCQTLNSVGGLLAHSLNTHQQVLVSHLEQRVKQLNDEEAS